MYVSQMSPKVYEEKLIEVRKRLALESLQRFVSV